METAPGLAEPELAEIELRYGFEFPDDLRAFLASALPVGRIGLDPDLLGATMFEFPDWRNGDPQRLRDQVEFPVTALLEDIERGHWPSTWGERPAFAGEAMGTARRRLAEVPRLVPVYAHRYLPSGRGTWGHPVLSMLGTDIIAYGADLADYLRREFTPEEWEETRPAATVGFWKDYLR